MIWFRRYDKCGSKKSMDLLILNYISMISNINLTQSKRKLEIMTFLCLSGLPNHIHMFGFKNNISVRFESGELFG